MSATAQNVFDRAVARNSLNNASLIPTSEALSWISTFQRAIYILAARLNPEYFGKTDVTTTRSLATDSWDLAATPGDIAALTKATVSAIVGTVSGVSVGTQINLVTSRFPALGVTPRAYIRGRKLTGYQSELGTGSNYVSVVSLDYAELPPAITSLTTTLRCPDEWLHLIEIPLARLFALRDKREEEVASLDSEYTKNVQLFQEAVFIYDQGATKPLASIPSIPISQAPANG